MDSQDSSGYYLCKNFLVFRNTIRTLWFFFHSFIQFFFMDSMIDQTLSKQKKIKENPSKIWTFLKAFASFFWSYFSSIPCNVVMVFLPFLCWIRICTLLVESFPPKSTSSSSLVGSATEKCRALFNTFQPKIAFRIETSPLISSADQMTCFSMKCNTGLKWVKTLSNIHDGAFSAKTFHQGHWLARF